MSTTAPDNIIPFPGRRRVNRILRFRVELVMTPYPIWRQIEVPQEYSFWDLHVAIQDAMGWQDRHLHLFTVDQPRTGARAYFGIPDLSGFHGADEIVPGWEQPVEAYFRPDCAPALYTYDLGDDWQHEVALEWAGEADPELDYPRCTAGTGACPPEDCGGTQVFAEWLARELNGADGGTNAASGNAGNFDPDRFDPARVVFDDPQRRWQRAFGKE